MDRLLKWAERSDGSYSATTRNGRVYRIEHRAEEWVVLTPYGGRATCSSLHEAKCEGDSLAQDLEGYENVR